MSSIAVRWGTAVERQSAAPITMSSGVSYKIFFLSFPNSLFRYITYCLFVSHPYCPFNSLIWQFASSIALICLFCHSEMKLKYTESKSNSSLQFHQLSVDDDHITWSLSPQ